MTRNLYTAGRVTALLFGIVLLLNFPFSARAQFIVTYAGNGLAGNSGDNGPATAAKIYAPSSLVTDNAGNLYINDVFNSCIRKVSTSGTIVTYAGNGATGYGGDGGPATAAIMNNNFGVAIDALGYLYVTDQGNSLIRKVSTSGTIMRYAGNGSSGYSGDGGPATNAMLKQPRAIAIDTTSGCIYLSVEVGIVRKVSASGTISHVAGYPIGGPSYGYSGDGGPASLAKLGTIYAMACDATGNLYICDGSHNVIRKINTAGIITTFAGNGSAGYSGDGAQATAAMLSRPTGICVSSTGEVYIADNHNHRVRKVNAAGIITTVAGTGVAASGGDNGPANGATLNGPLSVTTDINDNIYIGEEHGHRIRKIVKSVSFTKGPTQTLNICKDSGPKSINSMLTVQDFSVGLMDTWSLFAAPAHGAVSVSYSTTSTGGVLTPTGIYYTPHAGYSGSDVFKVKVSNSAASDVITVNVSISPTTLNAGTITGESTVCVGTAITLSNTAAGGVWSSSNNDALETPTVGGSLIVTGNKAPGEDTIWYTVSNSCGTVSTMKVVTVQPLPAPGLISGPAAVCVGSTITLNASVAGGTWDNNSPLTVQLFPMGVKGVIVANAPGNAYIKYWTENAWCKAITSYTLKVETFPATNAIVGPESVCVGSEITLVDAIAAGTWTSSNPVVATATNFNPLDYGRALVKGVSAGTATIYYEVTNSCGTDIVDKEVTVHPLPNIPVINRRDGVLFIPANYVAYQWTNDGWKIDGAVHDTCAIEANGNYAVTVSNIEGCSVSSQPYAFSGCDASELDIFPNPTFSKIYVSWCRRVNARIVASDGRVVGEVLNTREVDMDYLPPGVYVISFYDLKGKIIKSQKVEKVP